MLVALLLATLPVNPSAASEASATANVRFTHATLLDSGARVRFVDDEENPNGDFPPIEQMTREQLQREWDRLDSNRPGLGGAIGLLAGGAAVAIIGFYVAYAGVAAAVISSGTTSSGISPTVGAVLIVIGLVMLAGGIALAVVGGLKLRSTLHERSHIGEQMNRIQDRLNSNPSQPYYPPPPPGDQNSPPPPPPPPPSVQNLTPVSSGGFALASW
jgi:hypothetical protein